MKQQTPAIIRLHIATDTWYSLDHNVQKPMARATALATIVSLQKVAGDWATYTVKAVSA